MAVHRLFSSTPRLSHHDLFEISVRLFEVCSVLHYVRSAHDFDLLDHVCFGGHRHNDSAGSSHEIGSRYTCQTCISTRRAVEVCLGGIGSFQQGFEDLIA
jgi:hypothetical protein